jgi:hypothetical protein
MRRERGGITKPGASLDPLAPIPAAGRIAVVEANVDRQRTSPPVSGLLIMTALSFLREIGNRDHLVGVSTAHDHHDLQTAYLLSMDTAVELETAH